MSDIETRKNECSHCGDVYLSYGCCPCKFPQLHCPRFDDVPSITEEVASSRVKEARALIEKMREALMLADDEKGGSINSRMAVVDALTAATEWLRVNK